MATLQNNNSFIDFDTNRQNAGSLPNSYYLTNNILDKAFLPQRLQIYRKLRSDLNDQIQYQQQIQSEKLIRSFAINKNQQKYDKFAKLVYQKSNKQYDQFEMKYSQYVARFIYLLKKTSNLLKLEQLPAYQCQIVKMLIDEKLNLVGLSSLKKALDFLPLFDDKCWIVRWLDILQVFSITLASFWYPLEISFDLEYTEFKLTFDYLQICLNVIQLLIGFNRSPIIKGLVVKDKMTIFHNYLGQQLIQDLVSIFSLVLACIVKNRMVQIITIVLFMIFRLPRVLKIIDDLNSNLNVSVQMRDILSLINMVLTVILIVHVVACIWHGVSVRLGVDGWVQAYGFDTLPKLHLYQISFYWAAMTMTTVGYGDVTPKNQYEYLCANLTMLVACIVFGYTMNRIGMLLTSIQTRNADFKNNMASLNLYMRQNNVDNQLQSRIRSYLNYLWDIESQQQNSQIDNMIGKLPDGIQEELNYQVRGRTIENCKIFERFSDQLKKKLCHIVEGVQYVPDEVVFDPLKSDGSSLYIVKQGQLKLYNAKNQSEMLFIKSGQVTGEISFFTDLPRTMRVVSVGFSSCYKIPRESFLNLLKNFAKDRELFYYLKDSLSLYSQYQKIQLSCLCCQSFSHMIQKCPLVNLYLDRDKIIKKYVYPIIQRRDRRIIRCQREKYPTLMKALDTYSFVTLIQFNMKLMGSAMSQIDEDLQKSMTQTSKLHSESEDVNLKEEELRLKSAESQQGGLNEQNLFKQQSFQQQMIDVQRIKFDDRLLIQPIPVQDENEITSPSFLQEKHQDLQSQINGTLILTKKDSNPRGVPSFTNFSKQNFQRNQTPQTISPNFTRGSLIPVEGRSLSYLPNHEQQSQMFINSNECSQFQQNQVHSPGKNASNPYLTFLVDQHLQTQFEKMQEFTNYFPNGNIGVILRRFEYFSIKGWNL